MSLASAFILIMKKITQQQKLNIERLREYIINAFQLVERPNSRDIFDKRGDDTRLFQEIMANKNWSEISWKEAMNISIWTLNPKAYQYYVQAQLMCKDPETPLGLGASQIGLSSIYGVSPFSEIIECFTPQQLNALSLYVQLYGMLGEKDSMQAFEQFWSQYCLSIDFFD